MQAEAREKEASDTRGQVTVVCCGTAEFDVFWHVMLRNSSR